MKVQSESLSKTKSPGKVKKRKDEMISDLLAMTMAHIKVKKEPMSEEDSTGRMSRPSLSTPKKRIESNRDNKQTSESPKKKRSKPHIDHNSDINRGEPVIKKIKVEKISEDERHDFSPRKTIFKQNTESHSPVRRKVEKGGNNFMKERDALEKLFSVSAVLNKNLKAEGKSNRLACDVLNNSEVSSTSKSRIEVLKAKQSSSKNSVIKGTELPQQVQVKVEKTHSDESSSESESASSQLLGGKSNIRRENSFSLQGTSGDTSESSSSESQATYNRRKRLKSEKSPRVISKSISGSVGSSFGNNLSDSESDEFMGTQSVAARSLTLSTEKTKGRLDLDNRCTENTSESSGDENESRMQPSAVANERSSSTNSSDEAESLVKTKQVKIGRTIASNLKETKKHAPVPAQPESDADGEHEKLKRNHLFNRRITAVNNNSDKSSSAGTGQVKLQKTKTSNSKQTTTPGSMSVLVKSEKYSSADSDKDSVPEISDRVLPAVDEESSSSSNEEAYNAKTKQIKSQKNSDSEYNSGRSLKSKVAHMLFSNSAAKSSESESSSGEQVPIKNQTNGHPKAFVKKQRLPVVLPQKAASDTNSSSEDDSPTSHQLQQKNNQGVSPAVRRDTETSSHSDEVVPVPKRKQIGVKSAKLQNNSNKRITGSTRSSEDKLSKSTHTQSAVRNAETESSSEEDVPLPKPIKRERMGRPKASGEKKRLSVPLPIKTDTKTSDSGDSSSSDDDTPDRARQPIRKVHEKVLPAAHSGSESSTSSDEKSPVSWKLQNKENRRISGSTRSSEKKERKSKQQNNSTVRNSDMESSSDEDVSLPKPIKHERNDRLIVSDKKERPSVPVPIKAGRKSSDSEESSSSEDDTYTRVLQFTQRVNEKTSPVGNIGSESSSNSEDETSVPVPKQMKTASSKLQNEENRRIAVTTSSSQDKSSKSKIKPTQYNSLREDVPLPKPIKHERNDRLKASDKKQRLSVPLPIKADRKASDSEDSSSSEDDTSSRVPHITRKVKEKVSPAADTGSESSTSSDEETPVLPKLQNKNRQLSASNRKSEDKSPKSTVKPRHQNDSALGHSDVESSSDEDMSLPKPIKHERSDRSKAHDKKKRLSVPLPIKTDTKTSDSHSSSGSEEDTSGTTLNEKDQSIRQQSHSESSSEADVPPPKKIKSENNRPAKPRGNVQVPPPINLKRESLAYGDYSSSSDQEHSSRVAAKEVSKLAWKNGSEYSAMNWTEKIKRRFPGIEKLSIKLRLPEERSTKYSLLLVPKHLDPRNLLNLKCNLNKNTVVNLNNKEYTFEQLPKKPDPVVVNLDKPRLVNLHSVISLQQFVPELKLKQLVAPKRENVSLPSEIKVRHPLFGANYKEKISLGKTVKRKLQEAIHHKRKLEEKEKRRRKSKKESHVQSVEKTILDIFNTNTATRNINDIDLIPVKKEDSGSELNSSKSKHKNKHNREHDLVESEFLDSKQKKHKNKKKDVVPIIMETPGNSFSDDGHKKKKRKSRESFENSLENEQKKRKHK